MDVITIADLEVHYHIGVPDAERARPHRLLLTIELEHDFAEAAAAVFKALGHVLRQS